jgi:DNA-binding NtrC family response regulator
MSIPVVVFSPDREFAVALDQVLRNRFECEAYATSLAETAVESLLDLRPSALFVDTRSGLDHGETARLLNLILAGRAPAVNVITLGSASYPRALAAAADLVAVEHLVVGTDGPARLASHEPLAGLMRDRHPRPAPESRRVEAGDVCLTTYTPSFFGVIDDVMRVAHRDVTLLLVGETGTGKTTLARFIHLRSQRSDKPFQNLACGALPSDLIESELFGHVRGAFTGADRNKIGRFQAAGLGTLLLDEIDVLDPKQQAKLLKVIETGEYEMVGSTESRMSEARLIVASNVNLEELMRKSQFRSDLYYRLNVLEFRLPALRERSLDIVPLAMDFAEEFCREHQIGIREVHRDFLAALRRYRWPGNLRELKNHVRRAVLFCEGDELTLRDLSDSITQSSYGPNGRAKDVARGWTLADRIACSERELLEQALKANGNNRTRTARALGISRVGLYKKLRRLGMIDAREEAAVAATTN